MMIWWLINSDVWVRVILLLLTWIKIYRASGKKEWWKTFQSLFICLSTLFFFCSSFQTVVDIVVILWWCWSVFGRCLGDDDNGGLASLCEKRPTYVEAKTFYVNSIESLVFLSKSYIYYFFEILDKESWSIFSKSSSSYTLILNHVFT
jgi:hypothetical protein